MTTEERLRALAADVADACDAASAWHARIDNDFDSAYASKCEDAAWALVLRSQELVSEATTLLAALYNKARR